MLRRQKIVLHLISCAPKPLDPLSFVKLVFLLRQETAIRHDAAFYDFVPYEHGPFSFSLYQELRALRQHGYLSSEETKVILAPATRALTDTVVQQVPSSTRVAVEQILSQYGQMGSNSLFQYVCRTYPWFVWNSTRHARVLACIERPLPATPAVYTTGYAGTSIDAFMANMLRRGLGALVDVRANPISRKYGFSHSSLSRISRSLGLVYLSFPSLGIPSSERRGLISRAAYAHVFGHYQRVTIPAHQDEIQSLAAFMKDTATTLVCYEEDAQYCHRGYLAPELANFNGLDVVHL